MKKLILGLSLAVSSLAVNATTIIPNSTMSVANGDHDHSSGGNLIGVGYWYSEETRGVVEFDVSTIMSSNAKLSFKYSPFKSLYYGQDREYSGIFNLIAYSSMDATAGYADFSRTGTLLGSFDMANMAFGDVFTVDISSILAGLQSNYLGFLFDPTSSNSGAYAQESVFEDFSVDTYTKNAVSTPGTFVLMTLAFAGFAFRRFSKL